MKRAKLSFDELALLSAIVLRVASPATADMSYFVAAMVAMRGRSLAIQALALSWLFSMLNPAIAHGGALASVGRYAVVAGAALGVVLDHRKHTDSLAAGTLLLGGFLALHSVLFSAVVDVSVLKSLIWAVTMATLCAAWAGLDSAARERLIHRIFYGLTAILLLSLPLLAHPIGYKVNGTGFQGLLGHPQEFGVTMALLALWFSGKILAQRDPGWFPLVLFCAALFLIVRSEARTGALALILGVGLALFLLASRLRKPIKEEFPGLGGRKVHLFMAISLFIVLFSGQALTQTMASFLAKRTTSTSLAEAYETSRGELIRVMWANIQEHPLEGIGFGVASVPETMRIVRDPVLGVPVSALIEKGVLPVAVLEEVGLIGFCLVLLWLWKLYTRCARGGFLPSAIFFTVMLLNMGEAMFFSTSGMGLMVLILLGWGASFTRQEKMAA